MKATKLIVALCVVLQTLARGNDSIAGPLSASVNRYLRPESALPTTNSKEPRGKHDSSAPLQRRDQARVAAHRVYDPGSGLACLLVGQCIVCPTSEREESVCRETGYRQELDCPRSKERTDDLVLLEPKDERMTRFKACLPADSTRPGVAFVKFEAIVSGILAVSVILLRREQRKHRSSFDLRKA